MTDPKQNGDEAVRSVLADVLKDSPAGEQASGQTSGQINNPHTSSSHPSEHTDSWEATKEADGSVSYKKGHSDQG